MEGKHVNASFFLYSLCAKNDALKKNKKSLVNNNCYFYF
jgi:hypothetical protein